MFPFTHFRATVCLAIHIALLSLLVSTVASRAVILNDNNFDALVDKGDWLVEFYAPWCPHCRQLESKWDATAVKAKEKGFNIGKVDCTAQDTKDVKSRFKLTGYPSIFHIKKGEVRRFTGTRTTAEFLSFLNGGYKSVSPEPMKRPPAPPSVWDDLIEEVYFNYEGTLEYCSKYVMFCSILPSVLFFGGLVIGLLIAPTPQLPMNTPLVRTPRGVLKLNIKPKAAAKSENDSAKQTSNQKNQKAKRNKHSAADETGNEEHSPPRTQQENGKASSADPTTVGNGQGSGKSKKNRRKRKKQQSLQANQTATN